MNPPGIGDLVNYAGWNRQTNDPSGNNSFIIHHPQEQDMRLTRTSSVNSWIWNSEYWTAHYFSGTVDKGSSGSALMNEYGQIVGQLRSGWSNCNFTDFGDRYAKLNVSWYYANLQSWLSPNQVLQSTNLLNLTDITINGPSTIACTTPGQFSTLPGLLGVTYQWNVSPGLQILSGQGTASVSISGFQNNNVASGSVTLTLTAPSKGRTKSYTISKQIFINDGGINGTYNSPTNGAQPLSPISRANLTTNNTCLSVLTNMTIPAGSTVTWNGPANNSQISWYQSGNNVSLYFSDVNQTITLSVLVTNSCGSKNTNYSFTCISAASFGINPHRVDIYPNPSSKTVKVALVDKANEANSSAFSEVRIIDKSGNVLKQLKYGKATKVVSVDISGLSPDLYTILLFDGKNWNSAKFIKN